MKKIFLVFTIVMISLSSFGQSKSIAMQSRSSKQECTKDSFESFQAVFSFEKIESIDINTEEGIFSAISIAGAYADGPIGTPELPVIKKMVALPVGAAPKVVIKNYSTEEYNLSDYNIERIFPVQPPVSKSQNIEDVIFMYDEKAYSTNSYNEQPIALCEEMGTMRGMRFGMLFVNPVRYNPVSNSIIVYNDIEVEVVFEDADYSKTQSTYRNAYSPYFERYRNITMNRSVYDDHPDLYNTPVYMLVIANRMFEETLQPWIEWKTQKGFYMDVNYTDVIGTTNTAIKTFCHNKYNDGLTNGTAPTFIILVGDVQQVPASQQCIAPGVSTWEKWQTDFHYAGVDEDYFPEMYYSRMSAQTTQQLENIIEKILYYEKYQFEDPSYLDDVLLIAGADNNWNPKVGQPQINYATTYYYNEANGFVNVHKYLNSYSGCYANLNNVGFANYTAHCSETSWGDPYFGISNVNSLTNENKYFIAMGNCCLAADFAYSSDCIGEAFVKAAKKGAVGYIGSSPSSYWGDDFHFGVGAYSGNINTITTPTLENTTDGCYDLTFREADFNCLNSMIFSGNLAVTYAHITPGHTVHTSSPWYYWEAYNVLGDGSLMPYRAQGDENTVSHMEIFPLGINYFEVTADPGSYVAISKDGVLHGTGLVDESGTIEVIIEPILEGGEVDIVITGSQKIPYFAKLQAAALEGPYLTVESYLLDGDGILSYGETTEMELTIKNIGGDATTEIVSVVLTSEDEFVTIINDYVEFPIIEVGNPTSQSGFTFEVSKEIDNEQTISFIAEMTCGDEVWTGKINLKAYKPELDYEKISWQGGFASGETLDIIIQYKNIGGYQVSNVDVILDTDNPYVTINSEDVSIGAIASGGVGYAFFNITLSEDISATDNINFTTFASGDEGVITAEGEFTLLNNCPIYIEMSDSGGDGWNGDGRISIKQNNEEIAVARLVNGSYEMLELKLPAGELEFHWISGSYNGENSFKIYDSNNELIYEVTAPTPGLFLTHENTCTLSYEILNPPTNLVFTITDNTVEITWEDGEKENKAMAYTIIKDGIQIATVNEHYFKEENVYDGVHAYCVIAIYGLGSTSSPACENIVVGDSIGISEFNNDILVYPNPASNTVTVKGENISAIKIYNLQAQLLLVEKNTNVINVSSFNEGIYIISVETSDGLRVQKKIIVSR